MVALLSLALLTPLAAVAAETSVNLLSFNSLDGVNQTYLTEPARRLEIVNGKDESTDGDGAMLFGGHAPTADGSKYFGVMVPLAEPVDVRDRALSFDARTPTPEGVTAFYVRFYNRGETNPAWSFSSWGSPLKEQWRTFTVQRGLCADGLAWEGARVEDRVASMIDRVEFIIGTRDNDVEMLAVIDNLRMAPSRPGIQDLTEPKKLVRDTAVVVDGSPAAVVLHPDSDAGRAAAGSIVAMIREKTGVEIPAHAATEEDRQPDRTAFVIGNVRTNPAMLLLYARHMTPVDAICPGGGGALVHTVFDPFGKGVNGIVVGASDAEGLGKAVAILKSVVDKQPGGKSLLLPRMFERAYGERFLGKYAWAADEPAPDRLEKGLAEGQAALDEGKHTSIAGVLANVALRYQLTGHGVEAKLFVKLWDLYRQSAVADPRKFGGPWGFDSDFPSSKVVPGWRNIEYDPSLTDAERLATTKAMGRWLAEAVVPSCAGAASSSHVPHNHQTFPALGTLFAGLYFTEGFAAAEGERWLRIADAIFRRQATHFKPYEDCNGYQWLTNGHLIHYCLARPDFAFFENGNAQKTIDYCIGCMDNLGYQVPYGDTGSWQCWDTETVCLDAFAFVTGDPAAAWAAHWKHQNKNSLALYGFQGAEPGEAPAKYNGVRVWPLEPQYYHTHGAGSRPDLEDCFDKVSFRDGVDPKAAYLLLDGLSNGGHKHFDGNSIPRITQFGRIWLADNDYYKSAVKYHNSMLVFRDGESAQIPAYVELLGAGETARCGFSRTRLDDYARVDWERSVLWLKERQAFVVLDKLTALEANEYQFRLLWHGMGQATLRDEGLLLEQEGPSMWIQVGPGPELELTDDTALGGNWNGYAHAEPVVRSLSAIATVRLEQGDSYLFASALHGAAEGSPAPWQMHFAAANDTVVLDTDSGRLAIGPAACRIPTSRGELRTDAQIVVADARGFSLLHATQAGAGDFTYHDSAQFECVDVEEPDMQDPLAAIQTRPPVPNLSAEETAPPHPILWRMTLPAKEEAEGAVCTITRLATARLDGSDRPPTLLAATQQGFLFAVTADGTVRWKRDVTSQINDVTADDLNGDGKDEIVAGTQDHHVRVLDAAGKELWKRAIDYYRRPPYVNVVRTGDLDGDGKPEVVIGGENWRFYAFKADGTELWNYESVHPSRSGAVADLDGDGKAEVICGTHYYYMTALNPDGTSRWKRNFGPICYALTTGSFDGDNTRGVVCGAGDGCVHYFAHDGEVRMRYDTGDEVKHVLAADLDGDGKDEIIAGSLSRSVYCFGPDAQRRWRVDLGAAVSALAVAQHDEARCVIAATAAGRLVTLSKDGAVLASSQLSDGIRHLAILGGQVIAATSQGELVAAKTSP